MRSTVQCRLCLQTCSTCEEKSKKKTQQSDQLTSVCDASTSSSEERTTFSTASLGLDLDGDTAPTSVSGGPLGKDVLLSVGAVVDVSELSLDSQKDKSSSPV